MGLHFPCPSKFQLQASILALQPTVHVDSTIFLFFFFSFLSTIFSSPPRFSLPTGGVKHRYISRRWPRMPPPIGWPWRLRHPRLRQCRLPPSALSLLASSCLWFPTPPTDAIIPSSCPLHSAAGPSLIKPRAASPYSLWTHAASPLRFGHMLPLPPLSGHTLLYLPHLHMLVNPKTPHHCGERGRARTRCAPCSGQRG